MTEVFQFLFIVAVPLVLAGGALVTLFALGALFDALDYPERAAKHIEAAFRRPPKAPETVGPKHYYKPYWLSR